MLKDYLYANHYTDHIMNSWDRRFFSYIGSTKNEFTVYGYVANPYVYFISILILKDNKYGAPC